MKNIYQEAYEERTTHSRNLKAILVDALNSINALVAWAASSGVDAIDLAVLLEGNQRALEALQREQRRFEDAMKRLLTDNPSRTEAQRGEGSEEGQV